MSAFLGPIHYWLYNKIKIQNTITDDILKLGKEEYNLDFREYLDKEYGKLDPAPLEEQIDESNIHGWLQERVDVVENRLAYLVTNLLKEKPQSLEKMKEIYKETGAKLSKVNEKSTVSEIYKEAVHDSLLDGMPCDRVNSVDAQDEDLVIWKRNQCVHEEFWDKFGGDVKNYYLLRDEFIIGFLQASNATYEKIDEYTFKISR